MNHSELLAGMLIRNQLVKAAACAGNTGVTPGPKPKVVAAVKPKADTNEKNVVKAAEVAVNKPYVTAGPERKEIVPVKPKKSTEDKNDKKAAAPPVMTLSPLNKEDAEAKFGQGAQAGKTEVGPGVMPYAKLPSKAAPPAVVKPVVPLNPAPVTTNKIGASATSAAAVPTIPKPEPPPALEMPKSDVATGAAPGADKQKGPGDFTPDANPADENSAKFRESLEAAQKK